MNRSKDVLTIHEKILALLSKFRHNMSMINIKLTEDTKCIVIRNGEEETITHPKGTVFFEVEEAHYADAPSEWQHVDDDMVSTFIPQNKAVVLE